MASNFDLLKPIYPFCPTGFPNLNFGWRSAILQHVGSRAGFACPGNLKDQMKTGRIKDERVNSLSRNRSTKSKMKWRQHLALPLLACIFVIAGCGTPNHKTSTGEASSTIPETWEAISNQWGSLPVKTIKRAAKRGDAAGELYLGWIYWSGQGTATNQDEAIKWFERAASDGLAAAQNRLGWHYLHGVGVTKNADQALAWFHKAAQQGYVNAEYNLGTMYYSGVGVAQDYNEAFNHFHRAAEKGNASAQCSLGYLYREGLGTSKDDHQSVLWYRKSADQGIAEAQKNLGDAYRTGKGVFQDYQEAAKLYRLAADQGDAKAQNNLGWLFQQGLGVPRDPLEAEKWYLKAANQGETHGAYNLAWMYAKGMYGPGKVVGYGDQAYVKSGGVAPDNALGEKWMRKAVDLNSAVGQYQLGYLLNFEFNSGSHQDKALVSAAAEYFKKSADQGYDKAQYELALIYLSDLLLPRTNCIPLFLKAAAQGNAEAQAEVGNLPKYFPGNETVKSIDVAGILRQSAEAGNIDAQIQLAKRYQSGDGIPQNAGKAFMWMQKATEHNQASNTRVSDAYYELGLMYEKGEGVTADLAEARSNFLQAAAGFQPDACFRVGQMLEKGDGVPQDDYAAAKNYYYAMFNLGGREFRYDAAESLLRLYAAGRGLSKTDQEPEDYEDRELANKEKLLKNVERLIKSPRAMLYAGEIYHQGKVVPQDLVEAAVWFDRAAKKNADGAMELLERIEDQMSPAQMDAAKRRYYVRPRRNAP